MSVKLFTLSLILMAALLLGACQQVPTAAALPTPVLIQLQFTPTLRGLLPQVNACAREVPGVGVAVSERPAPALDLKAPGVALRWAAPGDVPGAANMIGWDTLAVVVHPGSPVRSLTLAQLKAIYVNGMQSWSAFLKPACKSCADDSSSQPLAGKEIHAWAYSPGDDIQQVLEGLLGSPVKPGTTYTAPDPEAMRAAVAADPSAIGFLPERLVNDSVGVVALEGAGEETLRQPVLALSMGEPEGPEREWLACLAEKIKHE